MLYVLLSNSITPTQPPITSGGDLAIFEIIIIPLLVCLVPAIISIISAFMSYGFSKKSGQDVIIHDVVKIQHDLVVAPIYYNLRSDNSFESIKITNDKIVDDNKSILTPDFLRTYNNAREKTQAIYTKAVEFLYNYTADILKLNSIGKAISKAERFLKKEEKRAGKRNRYNIFQVILDFISGIFASNYYEDTYKLSLQKSAIDELNKTLELKDFKEPEINEIISNYNDKKAAARIGHDFGTTKTAALSSIITNSLAIADFIPFGPLVNSSLSLLKDMVERIERNKKKNEWLMLDKTDSDIITIKDQELQDIWAAILASELSKGNQMHPRMIEAVKQISPVDAIIFTELVSNGEQLVCENDSDEQTLFALENLAFLGLIDKTRGEVTSIYNLTLFGRKFADIVLSC